VIEFSHKVTELDVDVASEHSGVLRRRSQYEFDYRPDATRPASVLMPVEDRTFRDGELFAAMDMNLPEGFLLSQLRERSPKVPPTKMQLLALIGSNGIGRLSFRQPHQRRASAGRSRTASTGAATNTSPGCSPTSVLSRSGPWRPSSTNSRSACWCGMATPT